MSSSLCLKFVRLLMDVIFIVLKFEYKIFEELIEMSLSVKKKQTIIKRKKKLNCSDNKCTLIWINCSFVFEVLKLDFFTYT